MTTEMKLSKYAIAALLWIVTVSVTEVRGNTATAQVAGTYQVVIVDLNRGTKHPWSVKTWPGQYQCDAALGNANKVLADLYNPDPAVVPETFDGADKRLVGSIEALVLHYFNRTGGRMPRFSISCELLGDPA